ncbi:MAG: helix-turn-helix domain-containing protein [Candidatus Woesearchaeota archaeon]|jgi:sugar-specific transcriptional regulator TrmB
MLEILQQIGLTPSEAKVYVALLETGKNTATGILNHAKFNSGRIYEVLTSLENKGLVSAVKEGKVKFFVASSPERVLDYLNAKMEDVNQQKNDFEKVLPTLKKSYEHTQQETDIEVFLGVKGQKTAYDILFAEAGKDKDKEIIVQGITKKSKYPQEVLDLLRFYVYKRRKELKLKVKKIADDEAKKEKMYFEDNSEIRYLPFSSTTSIQVLGEITMVQMPVEPVITIIIRNKRVAEDYKKQLKFLWSIAKK